MTPLQTLAKSVIAKSEKEQQGRFLLGRPDADYLNYCEKSALKLARAVLILSEAASRIDHKCCNAKNIMQDALAKAEEAVK